MGSVRPRPAENIPMLSAVTALLGIDTRLKLARLFFVTDARARTGDLERVVSAAFAGGVDVVELVDARLDDRAELAALNTVRRVAQRHQGLVAVHKNPDLAGEFAADVLHLPADGVAARRARRALHEYALIGRSCRSTTAFDAALADPDVNYLVADADPRSIEHAARVAPPSDPSSKPWFAAGGITLDSLDAVLSAGARRVAVSRAIARADDPERAAAEFRERLTAAWNADPAMEAVTMAAFGGRKPLRDDEAFPGVVPPRRRGDEPAG